MSDTTIGNYLPSPSAVPLGRILAMRQVLDSYRQAWLPDLDTRPGSVFGDLDLTPLAILMASCDIAVENIMSDLDPTQVANGIVYNPSFVQNYLINFGAVPRGAVATTGVVALRFNADKAYVLDRGTKFTFGSISYGFGQDEGSPVIVYPTGTTGQRRVLTRIAQNDFVVYFPVQGAPGGAVQDGTPAQTSLAIPELISVLAAGDFDGGSPSETVQQIAARIQQTFPSATLTTRGGARAFLFNQFPNLIGASIVTTGDQEMLRDSTNPLGVHEGKVDVFVKSRRAYLQAQQLVTLAYNFDIAGWVGWLPFPTVPSFFDTSGIFRVDNFGISTSINTVYSTSADETIDNLGVAFSAKEIIGLAVADSNPDNIQNETLSGVTATGATGVSLSVSGTFNGQIFSANQSREVDVQLLGGATTILASVTDYQSGESTKIQFVPAAAGSSVYVVDLSTDELKYTYNRLLSGLSLTLNLTLGEGGSLPSTDSTSFKFGFRARTADFSVSYRYDPAILSVQDVVGNSDNVPSGVDILAKSLIPCLVTKFIVNYRGTGLNLVTAQRDIANYINGLVYPDAYEDSAVSAIMINNGALGVQSIDKEGVIYPSLASIFVKQDGTQVAVPRPITTTLLPAPNSYGYGGRNINYILDTGTITLNAIS